MPRILVMDDDGDIRRMIKMMLRGRGYELEEAGDGGRGMELIRAWKPDLVITDIEMPVKDGLACIMEMRQTGIETRVIAISGGSRSSFTYLPTAEKLGAHKILPKPFSAKDLLAAVEELLPV